jgi:hypothetical protein
MAVVVALWLGGLLLIILFGMLRRRISLRGLLVDPVGGTVSIFARPQMLLIALASTATYLASGLDTIATTGTFPAVPPELLAVIGGSQALFVGGRVLSALLPKLKILGGIR